MTERYTAPFTALAQAVVDQARDKGLKLATAESCTGGLVSAALTDIPGSSDVFDRGFVTYSNAAKIALLDVPESFFSDFGAVSQAVAIAMANGALKRSDADITISITGVAGPGDSERKPAGLVHFSLAQRGEQTLAVEHHFRNLDRAGVRAAAVEEALRLLSGGIQRADSRIQV
tara:strand:- start:1092 stop:1613 length:522 start_codon:yes stop_codon:yes gene_type:complete